MVTLYNVISEDGYMARKDGSEHFIPNWLWPVTLDVFKRYEVLVMGRKTYDTLQDYPPELLKPFESLPMKKVVVTTDRKDFHLNPQLGYVVAYSPKDALALGANVLVCSGPTLNTFLLENKLVDIVIHHKIPTAIGEGIKPFEADTTRVLERVSEIVLRDGIKELTYKVLK